MYLCKYSKNDSTNRALKVLKDDDIPIQTAHKPQYCRLLVSSLFTKFSLFALSHANVSQLKNGEKEAANALSLLRPSWKHSQDVIEGIVMCTIEHMCRLCGHVHHTWILLSSMSECINIARVYVHERLLLLSFSAEKWIGNSSVRSQTQN